MISQFILSQIESLIPLLLFPHVLSYPAASINRDFGCRSIAINGHHVSARISDISSRIVFRSRGNYFSNPVAHGVVSEIDGGIGLNHRAHFSDWSSCYGQSFVIVFYQVSYGVVFVSASRSFML